MREYTLYCIGSDGDVEMRRDIYANDDLGALDQARALSHDYDVEVWQGTHVVTRLAKDGTETIWAGLVHIFDIKNHPNGAWRAYACSSDRDDDPCRLFTVLDSPNIDGPRKAVAAAIVGKHRGGK